MDSGYSKISRRSGGGSNRGGGGGGWQWMLLGFLPGLMCGAVVVFGVGLSGFLPIGSFGGGDAPVITEVVQQNVQITATPAEQEVVIVTSTATSTDAPPTATATLAATVTPTASPSPLPSATPDLTYSAEVQGEVNIRYGPGSDYPRVGVAQPGDRFQITAWHTSFDWVQIRYDASPTGFAWLYEPLLFNPQGNYERDLQPIAQTVFDNLPTLTPTPSVIQNSSNLAGDTVQISPEFANLGNRLFQLALDLGFDPQTSSFASLYLLDLQTGEAISYNSNVAYRGTSVNKISILASVYGALNGIPNQTLATDIANTMICSENASTNRVLAAAGGGDEWQGAQATTDMMRTIGLDSSFLLAPYTVDPNNPPVPPAPIPVPDTPADQELTDPEPYNQVTVDDMGQLLGSIYQCGYEEGGALISEYPDGRYEPRECRQMVHVMASNTVDGMLKAGVPANVRVAHKHGWIGGTHMNAGIFFTPGGKFVMAMAIHTNQITPQTGEAFLEFTRSLPLFAESSRMVYNYYNPSNPLNGVREGFIPEAPTCNFAGDPLIGDIMQPTWDE